MRTKLFYFLQILLISVCSLATGFAHAEIKNNPWNLYANHIDIEKGLNKYDARQIVEALKILTVNNVQIVTVKLVADVKSENVYIKNTNETAQGRLAIADTLAPLNANFASTLIGFTEHLQELHSISGKLESEFEIDHLHIEMNVDGLNHEDWPKNCRNEDGCIPVIYPYNEIVFRVAGNKGNMPYNAKLSFKFGPESTALNPQQIFSNFETEGFKIIHQRFQEIRDAE